MTIIQTTRDMKEAEALSDRIRILKNGNLTAWLSGTCHPSARGKELSHAW